METLKGKIVRFQLQGHEISLFVKDEDDLIQQRHAAGMFYEFEELQIIQRYFPGGCFVDIGAHFGNHTIYVSRYLNPTRVICIEPNPEAIKILTVNLQLNEISHIVDQRYLGIGLSEMPGTASLYQPQMHNTGAMQLVPGAGDIRLAVGDDLLHTEHPSFLKIDVEGMEIAVLNGLERLIARCSPLIFIEIDNRNREAFDCWLEAHGYAIMETYRRYAQNENFLLARR